MVSVGRPSLLEICTQVTSASDCICKHEKCLLGFRLIGRVIAREFVHGDWKCELSISQRRDFSQAVTAVVGGVPTVCRPHQPKASRHCERAIVLADSECDSTLASHIQLRQSTHHAICRIAEA